MPICHLINVLFLLNKNAIKDIKYEHLYLGNLSVMRNILAMDMLQQGIMSVRP